MDNKTKYIICDKTRYERKKAEHHCPRCGAVVKSGIYCADCKSKRAEEKRKKTIMLKEQGRCVKCGKTAMSGKTMCFNCALKQSERISKYYQSHKEQWHEYYLKRKERMKSECLKEPAETVNG